MISGLSEYLDNQESLSALFASIEQIVGRPLDSQLAQDIIMLVEEYEFDHDRVREFFEFLKDKGTYNPTYIRKTADTWKQNDIRLCEQGVASEQEQLNNTPETMLLIFDALKIQHRVPKDFEYEYYHRWVEEYQMDPLLIAEACKKTLKSIDSPSFSYANAILKNWHDSNIHTLEEYQRIEAERGENRQGVPKKNSFRNFSERTYDYEKLLNSIKQ